jgi:hypothetical protein
MKYTPARLICMFSLAAVSCQSSLPPSSVSHAESTARVDDSRAKPESAVDGGTRSRSAAESGRLAQLETREGTRPSSAAAQRAAIERGPRALTVDGDPNGLWWDDSAQTLFVTDDDGNRILTWTDAAGFAPLVNLPAAPPSGAGLGQLVRRADGSTLVPCFGGGTYGGVLHVQAGGDAATISGLAPARRRIGLSLAADGTLFDAWFERQPSGERSGGISRLSLTAGEHDIITGLQKPVGVLVSGGDLFVSDQELGEILKAPLSDPSHYVVLAKLDAPDLLAAGPAGSLFTGGAGGHVYRVSASGETTVFASGFQKVRGVAYDPTNRRLFVVDHAKRESAAAAHSIRVLPVD